MNEPDIALAADDYLLLTWLFSLPPEIRLMAGETGGDMMGSVIRPAGWAVGDWRMNWRFRYYRDARVWNSQDRKQWYGGVFRGKTEPEMEASIREFLAAIIAATAGEFAVGIEPEIFVVRGDRRKLAAKLDAGLGPEWMHGGRVRP